MVVSVFSREWMTRVNFMEAQLFENVSSLPGPLPARMLNEFAYCPRLAYLEWVQGDWAESADTVEGKHQHRNVDRVTGAVPAASDVEEGGRIHARSVQLSAPAAGLVARMDLLEGEWL